MHLNTASATSTTDSGASTEDISLDKNILRSQIRPRRTLAWVDWDPQIEHPRNPMGIPEPVGEEQDVQAFLDADVRLIPALAYDAGGHRLGQGGGYYDRIIPQLSEKQLAESSLGVVFAEEIYEVIPYDRWDAILPVLLTEEGIYQTTASV